MNTVPAQEIKKRGISAVDELLEKGPVHVIMRNRPKYVVMDEEHYDELLEDREEASLSRVHAAIEDVRAGRVKQFDDPEELRAAIMSFGKKDEPE